MKRKNWRGTVRNPETDRRLKPKQSKLCAFCGVLFYRKPSRANWVWDRTTMCSVECIRAKIASRTNERILAKVASAGPDDCWPWLGCKDKAGYGRVSFGRENKLAHRIVHELLKGIKIPDKLNICHTCDNPPCCNPKHHFIGTGADNFHDAVSKGRKIIKLDADLVRLIRQSSASARNIAAQVGVTERHIYDVRARRVWGHIP